MSTVTAIALPKSDPGDQTPRSHEHQMQDDHAAIYIDSVVDRVLAYLDLTEKPLSAPARALGKSESVISQVLNRKYPAQALPIVRQLDTWLTLETQRDLAPREPRYVETTNSLRLQDRLEITHEMGAIMIGYGVAGSGKTRAALEYKRNKGDQAILVTAKPSIRSPHAFLVALALAIKAPSGARMDQLQRDVEDKLRGTGRLLIVDEAERLTFRTIETIQSIHDECKIGVAFLADEVLWQTVSDGRKRSEYERFISRAPIRLAMNPVLDRDDVTKIAVQYLAHTDKECINFLLAKAGGVGGFRAVVYYAWMACRLAQAEKRPVVLRDLQRVAAQFGDEVTVDRVERMERRR